MDRSKVSSLMMLLMVLVLRRISWGLIQGIGKVMLGKRGGYSMTWVFSCCCCGGGMGWATCWGCVFVLFFFSLGCG